MDLDNAELPSVDITYNKNEHFGSALPETVEYVEPVEPVETKTTDSTTNTTKPVNKNKYTEIDNLDEDHPLSYDGKDGNPEKLRKPMYGIFSIVTPEGVMNTNVRAFKCRGVFDDYDTAQKWAKKIGENDVFDVFVGELYKWLPLDSDTDKATDIQYRNKKEQKLIMQQRENELNELVGRKKELLEKEKKGSRRRKADRILAGRDEAGGASSTTPSVEKNTDKNTENKKVPKVSRAKNQKHTMERLQKMVLERKKKKEDDEEKLLQSSKQNQEQNISDREKELKAKEESLSTLEKNMAEISKRLGKK